MVVYLVRSFGLMPESASHDWHVQPSCQRPNRGPPKRCEFSPGGNFGMRARRPHHKETDCPRNLTSIRRCAKSCQSALPTEFPDDFHNWTVLGGGSRRDCRQKPRFLAPLGMTRFLVWALECTQQYASSVRAKRNFRRTFCAGLRGRQEIEKRSLWRSLL